MALTSTEISAAEYFGLSTGFVALTGYLNGEPTTTAVATGLVAGIVAVAAVLHVSLPSATSNTASAKQ